MAIGLVPISVDDPFVRRLASSLAELTEPGGRLVVAVSGGADSVALLRAFESLKTSHPLHLLAAHLNHTLRGGESDEDERFVRDLCARLGIPCDVARADVRAEASKAGISLELAARRCRYRFLLDVAHRNQVTRVAVAHTSDDQAETILHRILRGTGLAGLAGMPVRRRLGAVHIGSKAKPCELVRPMLGISRREVIAFLERIGQPFREDVSNVDPAFTRNRLRHELIPLLERDYNPRLKQALIRLARQAGNAHELIETLARATLEQALVQRTAGEVILDARVLAEKPSHLRREVFRQLWLKQDWPLGEMGHREWQRLADGLDRPEWSADFPARIRAEHRGAYFYLRRRTN